MRHRTWFQPLGWACLVAFILSGFYGCGSTKKPRYPFGEFQELGRNPNQFDFPPVILVPGIKGSELVKADHTDQILWGTTTSNIFLHTFDELALYPRALAEGPWSDQRYLEAVDPLRQVRPTRVFEQFIIGSRRFRFGGTAIYQQLIQVLDTDPVRLPRNKMLFLFPYDWRLDNRVAAIQLAERLSFYENAYLQFQAELALGRRAQKPGLIAQCMEGIRRSSPNAPVPCLHRGKQLRETGALDIEGNVRFTLVAHSMGGLVSRYFVEVLGYEGRVNKLIIFGTPNLGAMDALRGLVEGEYPESVTSFLGFHFFDKAETRRIHLSFGSLFQLLPRYPEAVVNLEGDDLRDQFGLGNEDITADVIQRWKSLLLPPPEQLRDSFPDLEGYLRFQLESASCFHAALTGRQEGCQEERRIDQIVRYLKKVDASFSELPPKGPNQDPPLVVFGGHCFETLTGMLIDGQTFRFLEAEQPIGTLGQTVGHFYGDGRVPVKSLVYPREEKMGDATFLLCKDHMDIVKDKTLQYNLLRAIFKPASNR